MYRGHAAPGRTDQVPDAARGRAEVPPVYRWAAPAGWRRIDLVSDLHLCARGPRTFDAWAAHLLHTPADAVLLLGDVFEFWVGDDQRHGGFEQRCVQLLAEATRRRPIGFMAGNRDFLVGPEMLQDCGLTALPDPTALDAWGQRLLLTHGDALCLDDTAYQQFRVQSRGDAWQRAFAALPLAERLAQARAARAASDARRGGQAFDPELWADVDPGAAVAWLQAGGCDTLVHGHTHRPGTHTLTPGFTRHVLTDWDLDGPGAPRAEVLSITRDGLARVAPSPAG
jgi:UDP-2,3-diacylglucosamine hydrolase